MKKILLSTAIACFGLTFNSSAQAVLSQNFESGSIAPWTNTITGGGTGWLIASVPTAFNITGGLVTAHTKYALVDESVSSYNNPAKLTSPAFSLVGVTNPYLAYDHFFCQAYLSAAPNPMEGAWVQISTDGGTTYTLLDSIPVNYNSSTNSFNWGTTFISLGSVTPTATCKLQFCYIDRGSQIIGVAIDNIYVYGASGTDLGLTSVAPIAGSPTDYFLSGSSASFTGTLTNFNSTTDITSFTVNYQVGTSAVVSNTITSTVPHLGTGTFTSPTPYSVAIGQYPVKIWVSTTGDDNLHNDSMSTSIVGVPFMPKKRMLFEEGTGTWCGWCVRGIVYMDSLWRADSNNVSIVSAHDADPMSSFSSSTKSYDSLISSMIGGYPSMVIDRHTVDDPSGCFGDYTETGNSFGYANVGITTTTSGSDVTAHIKVEPAINLSGDYRLELAVTEDKVTSGGGGTGTWLQHNYYAAGGPGSSMPLSTIGYNFNTLPTDIPGVEFPFVARYSIPNDLNTTPNGVAGSLPSSMHFGVQYIYDFPAVSVPGTWNINNLRYTVMLIDNNPSNPTYGFVLNTANTSSHPGYTFDSVSFAGVAPVNAGIMGMQVFPNPASQEAHVRFTLTDASAVSFSIFDMVGRQVFTVPSEQMSAGGQQINISTANLAAGLYNVVLRTESGTQTQRLSVIK